MNDPHKQGNVLVINKGSPELNYLAAELSRRGQLYKYVRPYMNKGRMWESWLARVDGFGNMYRRTLGRRRVPDGLDSSSVHEVAVIEDFTVSLLNQMRHNPFRKAAGWAVKSLQYRIRDRLAKVGGQLASYVDVVVASYGVALPAFRKVVGHAVLNYSTAHHRFMRRILREEALRDPEFAATSLLTAIETWPEGFEARLDAEIAEADRILVGSSFARESFINEDVPSEKVVVVSYGADISLFSPRGGEKRVSGTFNVLFVGQIRQSKGISYLLKAYQKFRRPGTQLTLVGNFVGDPSVFDPYRSLFRHISTVPRVTLAEIYRSADVFVFPTLTEGMPLVVLEAMASGLPVISTPNGPGDLVRDGVDGFIVPIRGVDALVERMEYLWANPEVCRQMGIHARQRVLEFTWQSYAEKVVRMIPGERPTLPAGNISHREYE